ncbi:Zf-C3H1 domain-containing protein [Aphelenchoides bicaudatus]|nr:Zf-C3H1 domain-containing protein [Aphelenchoides bicaudatus]
MDADQKELEAGEIPSSPDANYELVDMELGSSENESDGEAERLRQILLDQMNTKRSSKHKASSHAKDSTRTKRSSDTPSKNAEPDTLTNFYFQSPATLRIDSRPSSSTAECSQTIDPPSFLPPRLSPPGFNTSPSFNASSPSLLPPPPNPPMFNQSAAYADESYNPDIQLEDTPRSPDNLLALSLLVQSSDEDSFDGDDEMEYSLDLEEAKRDSRESRKEIDRLLRKQRLNDEACAELRRSITYAKRSLIEMEAKLEEHMEAAMQITARIQTQFERQQSLDAKNLSRIGRERANLKSKVDTTKASARLKMRNLKRQLSAFTSRSPSKQPLSPTQISALATPSSFDKNQQINTPQQHSPVKAATSNIRPPHLNVQSLVNNGDPDHEAEKALRHRLMNKKKRTKSTESMQEQKSSNSTQTKKLKVTRLNAKEVGAGVQDNALRESLNKIFSAAPSFPRRLSHCGSLEEAVNNPLVGLKTYRLFPSFPFEYIEHPALSNRLQIDKPLCPFELNGICADPTCEWQHERDFNIEPEEIIKQLLALCPNICPPNVNKDKLASKLLEMNSVDYIARLLSAAITEEERNVAFTNEIQTGVA